MNDLIQFIYSKTKKETIPYNELLTKIQTHISNHHSETLTNINNESKIKNIILDYLKNNNQTTNEYTDPQDLCDSLYKDMSQYSFLTDILKIKGLEELNINRYDDIEIIVNGKYKKLDKAFPNPSLSVDVIRRMLQASNMIIDDSQPIALGHLSKNTRISAIKSPIVDPDAGLSASIRIINSDKLSTDNLIQQNTATPEMLEFIKSCIRYGVSICFAGPTGSGKTTIANWLLSTVPDSKRIFTLEDGSRELDIIKRDKNGKVTNRVVSTITRQSDNKQYRVTLDDLLDISLRFHPDIIVVGEMRGEESFLAQEAARTGHTVITTIHSNSCESTYRRMMTLAMRKYEMDQNILMELMAEAFPIIVYCQQLEDRSRKITEITEAEGYRDGKIVYRSIYRYIVDENVFHEDRPEIKGHFEKADDISELLYSTLRRNGAPKNLINKFKGGCP